jgi:protein gp37
MADHSKIEWTDATLNAIKAANVTRADSQRGWFCNKIDPCCTNCYAAEQNQSASFMGGNGLAYVVTNNQFAWPYLDKTTLAKPLHWKRPRKIFVCSMTDLFFHLHSWDWVDQHFLMFHQAHWHVFQVLTKRDELMEAYFQAERTHEFWRKHEMPWPLPNVWLGVTAGTQEGADLRIPRLLRCPAAVRYVSGEPLLELVNYRFYLKEPWNRIGIDQLIIGGESGKKARPMSINWARDARDACRNSRTTFFFKQWGEWAPQTSKMPDAREVRTLEGRVILRVGKHKAGRLLDGREYNGYPPQASLFKVGAV